VIIVAGAVEAYGISQVGDVIGDSVSGLHSFYRFHNAVLIQVFDGSRIHSAAKAPAAFTDA
jgi:hypothetical protein